MAKLILIFLVCLAQSAYALQGNFAANFSIISTFFPKEKTGQLTSNSTHVANGEFGVGFDNKLFSVEGGFSYDIRDNLAIGVNAALVKSQANSAFFTTVMQASGQMFDNETNFAYAAAEGMFKLENYGPVVPVLGVGAGITSLSFASYNSLGFLYQLIGGVEIALTDSFYLNVIYRYNYIKSVDFDITSIEYLDSGTIKMEVVEGDFLVEAIPMHSVGMGIKFVF